MNKQFLKNNSLVLIIIFICSIVSGSILGSILYKIPSYQKIELFISSSYVDETFFSDRISEIDNVKKVNVILRSPNNNYYDESFQTVGIYSDILIVSEKYLKSESAYMSFSPIDKKYFDEFNLDYDSYEKIIFNDLCYGIVVYDNTKEINLFKDKIVFENDERYVMIIGKTTPNIYENTSSKKTNNAFISYMKLLSE